MTSLFSLLVSLLIIVVSAKEMDDLKRITFRKGLVQVSVKEQAPREFLQEDTAKQTIVLEERALQTTDGTDNTDSSPLNIANASNTSSGSFGVSVSMTEYMLEYLGLPLNEDIIMQVVLSTADIGFSTGGCDAFRTIGYGPSRNDLSSEENPNGDDLTIQYPFFSSKRVSILSSDGEDNTMPNFTFAGLDWFSITNQSVWVIDNCQYLPGYFANSQAYGWIGLGIERTTSLDNEDENYEPNLLFSILINSTTGEGQIIFGVNSTYINESESAISYDASDEAWGFSYYFFQLEDSYLFYSQDPVDLTFDLLYEGLALPAGQYEIVMPYLLNFTDQGMNCSYNLTTNFTAIANMSYVNGDTSDTDLSDTSDTGPLPVCYFTGDLQILPNITYNSSNSDKVFTITPLMYMEDLGNSTYKTLFGPFDTQYFGSQLTVLGYKVMSKFYSVFNASTLVNPKVTLYPVNQLPPSPTNPTNPGNQSITSPSSSNHTTLIIIIVVVAVCALLGAGFLLYRVISLRKKQTKSESFSPELRNSFSGSTDNNMMPFSG